MKAEHIDHMGDDLTVVNAARVSFDKEGEWEWTEKKCECGAPNNFGCTEKFKSTDCKMPGQTKGLSRKDAKLINYLARYSHWTPFSHPQITLRYTVPIFVARQEFKHIVGFTRNEVSRRYVDDEPEFFIPEVWRSRPSGSVKQGSGLPLDREANDYYHEYYDRLIEFVEEMYNQMISDGVAPEQARMVLPQSMYTSYYITGSLAAFARFYRQRTDEHAQVEIQELAEQVGNIIKPLFPVSWSALTDDT